MFDDQITISRLSTEAPLSQRLFDVMDRAALADADENGFRHLPDVGDDAVVDGREVIVKDGDTMIWVEVEPEGGAEPGSDNPAIDLAAAVLELGLQADPAPSCEDLEDVVADEVGPVADTMPHSGFIGVNDISITSSGCALELDDGTEVTIATSPADVWDDWVAASEDSTFAVSYQEVEVLGRRAFDDGDKLVIDDGTEDIGDSPFEVEVASTTLDEGQQAELRIALAELALNG